MVAATSACVLDDAARRLPERERRRTIFNFTVAGWKAILSRTLPVVLSPDEVTQPIAAAGNLKHQTALSVVYACVHGGVWRVAHAQGKMLEGGWLFPGLDPVDPLSASASIVPGGLGGSAVSIPSRSGRARRMGLGPAVSGP